MTIMKKWIISILATLIIGGGATTGVVLAVKNQPENVAISAIAGVFNDALERPEIEPLVNMIKGGSLSLNMTSYEIDGENRFEELDISKLGGKIYFSDDNKLYIEKAGVDMNGESIRFDAFFSDELLYVKSDLLGGAYGVKYKEALEQFEESIFHKDADSDYSLDKSTSNYISELLERLADSSKDYEDMANDLTELLEYYVKAAWDIACETIEIESETKSVKLGKERVNARVITFSFDERDLSDIIDAFAEFIESDDRLQKFIDKYEAVFGEALETLKLDSDDIVDELVDLLDELAEEVDDFGEVTVEIVTPKLSSKLLKATLKYEDGDYVAECSIDCGKDGIADTDRIAISGKYTRGNIESENTYIYAVSKNDSKSFKSSLVYEGSRYSDSYSQYEVENELFNVSINKSKGSFTIEFLDGSRAVTGKYSQSGSATKFTVQKLLSRYDEDEDFEAYAELNLEIIFNEKDKMPSVGKYKELADITEKDVDKLLENIEDIDVALGSCEHEDYDGDGHCDYCDERCY